MTDSFRTDLLLPLLEKFSQSMNISFGKYIDDASEFNSSELVDQQTTQRIVETCLVSVEELELCVIGQFYNLRVDQGSVPRST